MRPNRRGAYAIEFTLILPVWLALVFGAFDMCWFLYRASALSAAAVLGCEAGALLDPGDADEHIVTVEAAVTARVTSELVILGLDGTGVVVDAATSGSAPDRRLLCVVDQSVPSLSGYVLGTRTIQRGASARLQWQYEATP